MKKLYIKSTICIILSLVSSYAILSIWWFNWFLLSELELTYKPIIHFIIPMLVNCLFLLILKYITRKDIKNIINNSKNDENSSQTQCKESESLRRNLLIINSVLAFLLIVGYYQYGHYKFISLMTGVEDTPTTIRVLLSIIFAILSLIPSVLLINSICKFKEKKPDIIFKILRGLRYAFVSIIAILVMIANVFYYIKIAGFKYIYEENDDGILIYDFQDIRDWENEKIIIPRKIWGKPVLGFCDIGFSVSDKTKMIIIPNSLKFDYLKNSLIRSSSILLAIYKSSAHCDLVMEGEPVEWYIKDNIIYDMDNREMIMLVDYTADELYIGNKIETIYPNSFFTNISSDTQVIIDEANPYYYEYGNVIWSKGHSNNLCLPLEYFGFLNNNNSMDVGLIKSALRKKDSKFDITMSPNISKPIFLWHPIDTSINKIIIPKDFLYDDFQYQNPSLDLLCDSYEVEDGNPLYTTYQGNLYSKDLKKLYAIRKYDYMEELVLPDSLEDISKNAIIQINDIYDAKDLIIKASGDLIYEQGNLYTNNYEKLLLNKRSVDWHIISKPNTNSMSNGQLEYEVNYMNQLNRGTTADRYYIENDSGEITKSSTLYYKSSDDLVELVALSAKDSITKVDKNCYKVDERVYPSLCYNYIEVESGNAYFEAENGALYTKEKEELLSVYKRDNKYSESTDYKITISSNTSKISDVALKSMVGYNIECDSNNSHFEVYKGNLYTKGREELLCFGKIKDNKIIIAKETKSISEDTFESMINYYNQSKKNEFEIVVEDGNMKYGIYEGDLYKDDFSTILLVNHIEQMPSKEFVVILHPECKHYSRTASLCMDYCKIDVSNNKYIKKIKSDIGSVYRVAYYPEYAYLNLDK